jgi:hypothetical protein
VVNNVNSASCYEVLLKIWDAVRRKLLAQLAITVLPDPIEPEQPRREFKNYSGNFLNIRLTARASL